MYFSTTHTHIVANSLFSYTPQINETTVITDTANWTLVSGLFIANGGEQYIIIGNFYLFLLQIQLHQVANIGDNHILLLMI